MRQIRIHQRVDKETHNLEYFCFAQDEIPEQDWNDWVSWTEDNNIKSHVIGGETEPVYRPKDILDYLHMKGYQNVFITQFQGTKIFKREEYED